MESMKSIEVTNDFYDPVPIYPLLGPDMLLNVYNSYKDNGEDLLADYQAETINDYILQSDALCWLPDQELSAFSFSAEHLITTEDESPKEVWAVYPGRSDLEVSNTGLEVCSNPTSDAKSCYTHMTTVDNVCQKIFNRRPVQYGKNPKWDECLMRSVMVPQESDLFRLRQLAKNQLKKYRLYNSAHYVPSLRTVYFGVTDPRVYKSFIHQDIVAHEFGHAVTDSCGGLTYSNESGALNESLSDVFAIMVKHYPNVQANDPDTDWLIANGLIVREDTDYGTALRSMRSPGGAFRHHKILESDSQVGHMSNYINTTRDHGGVHSNSGIPNRAFYLASYGIGSSCWETTGQIWYSALQKVDRNASFSEFAALTIQQARELYKGNIENLVAKAWSDVGVDLRESLSHNKVSSSNKSTGQFSRPLQSKSSWKAWIGGTLLLIGSGLLVAKAVSSKKDKDEEDK